MLLWDPSRRSSVEISHAEISSRVLTRDLFSRSWTEIWPGHLLRRPCTETLHRDLLQRSCQEDSYINLAKAWLPRELIERLAVAGIAVPLAGTHCRSRCATTQQAPVWNIVRDRMARTSGYETWTGFELVFWFFRGSGRVDPAKPGYFSQFGVFFRRMPLKNQVLPPDTGKGVLKESGPANTMFFRAGVLIL